MISKITLVFVVQVCVMETLTSSAEKKGETPEILLSLVFSASFKDVSASLSDDSMTRLCLLMACIRFDVPVPINGIGTQLREP